MIKTKMTRHGGVEIFILTYSVLASTLRNISQVQSFTPTSSLIQTTNHVNDVARFRSALLPSNLTPKVCQFSHDKITSTTLELSDWSGFEALDDIDDDSDYLSEPIGGFAEENDDQERKAEVGAGLPCPEVYWKGEPIFMPQGEILPLTEENVQGILAACRTEIGTMFGYSAENRGVGITGGVDFVELDGPNVVVTLKGRYWHQRTTVLKRVGAYIMGRIPEVVDVIVYDEYELSDEVNNAAI